MNQTGSYIKTAAHYNAGPVILKWDARFGDPRKMTLNEVINWVELIPYAETRNYVQRIIENMQIYRYILTGDTKLRIKQDLML
jgi:soluble lytic murein transglycosylase